jgi:hypothetical protein
VLKASSKPNSIKSLFLYYIFASSRRSTGMTFGQKGEQKWFDHLSEKKTSSDILTSDPKMGKMDETEKEFQPPPFYDVEYLTEF